MQLPLFLAALLVACVSANISNVVMRKSSLAPLNNHPFSHFGAKLAALQGPNDPAASNASTPSTPSSGLSGGAVAGIAVGGVVAIVAVVGGVYALRRRNMNKFNNGVTGIEGGYVKVSGSTGGPGAPLSSLRSVVKGFNPTRDDELTLFIGDQVRVVERHDDGWGRGIVKRTEGEGYFPLSVVGEH
ncbi:hypothetical protein HDU80_006271 [Chytriomyces hyalinus]|nr:hypothetical protein HDU80_006271 [Chytriomyces hyalinus]